MAYIRIHCDSCGGTWEVYRYNYKESTALTCPHCGKDVDRELWRSQVIPALGAVMDANAELFKYHIGLNEPLFFIDIIGDQFYQNRRKRQQPSYIPIYDDDMPEDEQPF